MTEENADSLVSEIQGKFSLKHILIISALFVTPFFFTEYIVAGLLVSLAVGGAIAANFLKIRSIGIEFTTFAVLMIAMSFGPRTGAIVGFALIFFQMFGGSFVGPYVMWVIPTYVVTAVLAGVLAPTYSAVMLGISLVLFIHVICTVCTAIMTPNRVSYYLTYAVGNTLLNISLILVAAEPVLSVIGV